MPENEKSAGNTKRIFDIQELIKNKETDIARLRCSTTAVQDEVKRLEGRLATARAEFDLAQKAYDDAIARNDKRVREQIDCADGLKSLKSELEELLRPYDRQLAEMKARLEKMEEEHCEHLKGSMASCGWSDEDCRAAARNYVMGHPDRAWYQQCEMLLERVRKCEYGAQMESDYGLIKRLSGL